ncbi:uncharacterized protein LOC131230550 [Magnolia sinica]|uniref:uncharacterized protein LOC131230550 n=1 Tax=Magnolia sinica TaxID=86752 RepID=UPI00265AB7D8|nr:uncharacterized protein LOC131230550 [Magnolia sinica]
MCMLSICWSSGISAASFHFESSGFSDLAAFQRHIWDFPRPARLSTRKDKSMVTKKVVVVVWNRLDRGWVKLNVDGSALHNPGPSRGGGICRKDNGDVLFAFHRGFGVGSNDKAELMTVFKGLSICISLGLWNVVVESDSKLVMDLFTKISRPGWKWHHWVARIFSLNVKGSFRFSHTLRQGNLLVDVLAQLGSTTQINKVFFSPQELPCEFRGLVVLDKAGLSAIRLMAPV